jgi:PBP1b-binding outer membrane lipoprotein LpoB
MKMKGTVQFTAVLTTALLLAACARKEEAPAPVATPEPVAEAPVEMAPPADAAATDAAAMPADGVATEAVPAAEGAATDAMATEPAATTGDEEEQAGGDRVRQ